ncbi:hypothetical protein B0T25DRAFT_514701 [Lasiosphaeria hispida]|uniref:Interferon-related developmental regulator N-terminal domain-containing protein n=1 Tax=Lasiosphaeria hispida TaxID=260671 RepID=A0AAJ0MHB4_9PEZI|nr:hypothetical protein B0T25DRAFT_514701 [Lasiosphaeria hispida]
MMSDENEKFKIKAIDALSIALQCGGGDTSSAEEVFEAVSSDDSSVNADNSAKVAIAAIQAWVFGGGVTGDSTHKQYQAFEIFFDQLERVETEVQCSAGAAIAYLLEQTGNLEETAERAMKYAKRSTLRCLTEILRKSGRPGMNRKERKNFRSEITDIITSLELGAGPGYLTNVGRRKVAGHSSEFYCG